MENVLVFALASALVGLLFSRIHFHFSFSVDLTKSSRLHSAPKPRRERETRSSEVSRSMAMGTAGKEAGDSGGAPAVRSIRQYDDVSKRLEAARRTAEGDISSALANLGMPAQKARELAKKAMEQGEDFDARIKWAMANVA
jgi:hypothetical protein